MDYRTRSIIVVMATTFPLSLAIMWPWNQNSGLSPSSTMQPLMTRAAAAVSAVTEPVRRMTSDGTATPQASTSAAAAVRAPQPAPAPAFEVPPSNLDGPELPVVFSVGRRMSSKTVQDDSGEEVDVPAEVVEGIVFNRSDRPLTITVLEVNVPTQETSRAQITLARGMQKRFGIDQGLKMVPGDQLTLRSPTFRDRTEVIP